VATLAARFALRNHQRAARDHHQQRRGAAASGTGNERSLPDALLIGFAFACACLPTSTE
jgi:hypothetical protein